VIQGKSPSEIQRALGLPFPPTHVCDVRATGVLARIGVIGSNFGGGGDPIQIQLLNLGATFSNPRPISSGGLK
jgi:hypothetical protein